MTASLVMAFIQFCIGQGFAMWKWARQEQGMDIPDWPVILQGIDTLQAKIDAEKVK